MAGAYCTDYNLNPINLMQMKKPIKESTINNWLMSAIIAISIVLILHNLFIHS
jgi:hypothetical protein